MTSSSVTVLSQLGPTGAARIAEAVPAVEVVDVPMSGPVERHVRGDVLVAPVQYVDNLADVLARGVRWFHEFGTGVDAVPFDLVFADPDRTLTCSRGASAIPIAEWVIAHVLAADKGLPDAWVRQPPAGWSDASGIGEVNGKVLGLVGLGGIGQRVARLALALGMSVVAVRRGDAPSPVAGVDMASSVGEVLAVADHLVLAAPATAATRHLLDHRSLAQVKAGVHVVNVARGSLIDQDALREALDDGRVRLASLDVCEPEPLPAGHWLYEHPQVRLSPHVAWGSSRGLGRIMDGFLDNLRRYVAGEPLTHVVDPELGY